MSSMLLLTMFKQELVERRSMSVFADLENSIKYTLRLIIAFTIIYSISFVLRIFTRLRISRSFAGEDWTMVLAFSSGIVLAALTYQAGHLAYISLEDPHNPSRIALTNRLLTAMVIVGPFSVTMIRISFGLFFLTIFAHKRFQRLFIWTAIISTCILTTIVVPLFAIQCPAHQIVNSTCSRAYTQTYRYQTTAIWFNNVLSLTLILGDFGFAIMGLQAMYHTQLPLRAKIPVGMVLAIGLVTGICSTVRMAYVIKIWHKPDNIQMDLENEGRWLFLEDAVGLLVANLVYLKPLFKWTSVKARSLYSSKRTMSSFATSNHGVLEMDSGVVVKNKSVPRLSHVYEKNTMSPRDEFKCGGVRHMVESTRNDDGTDGDDDEIYGLANVRSQVFRKTDCV